MMPKQVAARAHAVLLRPDDNVAVAARPLPAGACVQVADRTIELGEPITLGHKFAIEPIPVGALIRKYGQIIGFAARAIAAGSWVHTHNVRADLFEREHAFSTDIRRPDPPRFPRTFEGFLRPDGRVGTRNYVAVVSTVNCSASTSRLISDRFRDGAWKRDFPNVDGVFAVTHKGGCGLPFEGPDFQVLERVLAGFATHPNVAAYLIVGLGCEGVYASHLVESQDLVVLGAARGQAERAHARPRVLNIQEEGGISRTVESAVEAVFKLMPQANAWRRTSQPAAKLKVALECGGSDGNSGVTANPALGIAADLTVAHGGTAILGETTEIYGAEHLLTRRAIRREVGEKLLAKIRWWEWYTGLFGAQINNNPSPGNKAGGLTTIYEKSLGAAAKAGSTPLVEVVDYAARVDVPGLVFMDTPGYDPPCTTGLVASGANVLVFTTGRGSVLGLRPTPCIKVATNTPLFERMPDDMDLNAGTILEGEPVESVGARLFDMILDVASGRPTKSERLGVGEEEFDPWQIGPTL